MTPNARSKALLEGEGFTVEIVERFNHWSTTRHDLFNAFDLLAVGNGETLAVQATTDGNLAARRTKLAQCAVVPLCVAAKWRIEIHGWAKKQNRWRCRRESLGLEAQVNVG